MAKFDFEINGEAVSVSAAPDMPLLWLLRDRLNLTGTKFGCGAGLCGACTVMLEDSPVRACQITAEDAEGQSITTIEGLKDPITEVLQRAWLEHDVVQCGYCQSGQIISATALLRDNKAPSIEDIDDAMDGNICRCGSYNRIREAILAAARSLGGQG